MGFIHRITAAGAATALMEESGHPPGSVRFAPPSPLVTDLHCTPISTTPAAGVPQPGHAAVDPIPLARFRLVEGREH
jgi:hypothetical protein